MVRCLPSMHLTYWKCLVSPIPGVYRHHPVKTPIWQLAKSAFLDPTKIWVLKSVGPVDL